MRGLRVVLDTNVLVSGLAYPASVPAAWAVVAWFQTEKKTQHSQHKRHVEVFHDGPRESWRHLFRHQCLLAPFRALHLADGARHSIFTVLHRTIFVLKLSCLLQHLPRFGFSPQP